MINGHKQDRSSRLPNLVLKKDAINFDPKSVVEKRSEEKFKQLRQYQEKKKAQ
jgi:hypothetical protein